MIEMKLTPHGLNPSGLIESLSHEDDNMDAVYNRHRCRPPAMLLNGTVVAPMSEAWF